MAKDVLRTDVTNSERLGLFFALLQYKFLSYLQMFRKILIHIQNFYILG